MVMAEQISRLMDGELEDVPLDAVVGQLKRPEGMDTWVCYHVIGDALRGADTVAPGFSRRFAARLAAEPTVLAPRAAPSRPATYAWAVAAGMAAVALVGWVAFGTLQPEPGAIAKASEAGGVRAPGLKPTAVPTDYIVVHHEYSPTTQIQGIGPYLQPATAVAPVARP
jgi:sigma-E factor negative regulatory protein RseA